MMKGSALFRTVLTSLFVLLMLAAGHLLMVVINAAEVAVESPRAAQGVEARMFSDQSMAEEIDAAMRKTKAPEKLALLEEARQTVHDGKKLELRTLPVTRFLVGSMFGLTLLGGALLWVTSRLKGDTAQSIVGIFGGNLIWTGAVEYGLTIAARSLGIGKTVGVVDGQVVAIYGEYVLLKYTIGVLVLVMAYLLFLEASRCPVFLWWRKNVPTMRGAMVNGKIDNYGPRSAFQYSTTVWGFYLLLLWAYDERVLGVHSITTKAILALSIGSTLYCVRRLHQQTGWGPAVRYAVGAMILAWTPIEILGKWGVFREPWLLLKPDALLLFFGGLALGTWALWRAQRRAPTVLVEAEAPKLVPEEPVSSDPLEPVAGYGVREPAHRVGRAMTA
jgi:hypothetical protein